MNIKKILLMAEILHQLRLVVYPIIYDGFYTSQLVIAGFLNHQQYLNHHPDKPSIHPHPIQVARTTPAHTRPAPAVATDMASPWTPYSLICPSWWWWDVEGVWLPNPNTQWGFCLFTVHKFGWCLGGKCCTIAPLRPRKLVLKRLITKVIPWYRVHKKRVFFTWIQSFL